MIPSHDHRTLIHDRAALGDTILLWPLLRALVASTGPLPPKAARRIAFACDAAKARLASRFLDVDPIDAESPIFRDLWREEVPDAGPRFTRVIWFGSPEGPEARARFNRSLRAAFGATDVLLIEERPDRSISDRLIQRFGLASVPVAARRNDSGPVVLHVGAGSADKRWPMERWCEVRRELAGWGKEACLIAGEVEHEQLATHERELFASAGGRFIETLDGLADRLIAASVVVAGDTGAGHLAAQLGVPTVSLFGPTEASRWAPVGPLVRVLAPPSREGMAWLAAGPVLEVLHREFSEGAYRPSGS